MSFILLCTDKVVGERKILIRITILEALNYILRDFDVRTSYKHLYYTHKQLNINRNTLSPGTVIANIILGTYLGQLQTRAQRKQEQLLSNSVLLKYGNAG